MEGLLCQPDIRGFLLQAGVGFFGEREILGEEEAVRGGDAEAGPLRLDAGIGERRQVGGGQTEGTIAPGRDGQGARRLAGEGTGGNVLQEVFGGETRLFTAAGEQHELGTRQVDGVKHLRIARTVVGERSGILPQQEVVHFVGDGARIEDLASFCFGPGVGGGDERAQRGESHGDIGRITRGLLESFATDGGVRTEDQSGEQVGFGLAGRRQLAGGGEGLGRAFGVLALREREGEIARVGVGERRAAGFVGEFAQGTEGAVLDLTGKDRGAVAQEFDALTLLLGDGGAADGFLAERDVQVVALGRGDHPAQGMTPGCFVGRQVREVEFGRKLAGAFEVVLEHGEEAFA